MKAGALKTDIAGLSYKTSNTDTNIMNQFHA
jgi:hypothetical protein